MPPQICPDEDVFVALLSGDLTDPERASLDEHIDSCEACAELVIELTRAFFPDDDPDHAPSPDTIGRYEIVGVLGAGGMGVVYEARDPNLKRRVAIKLLRADVFDRKMREACAERLEREAQLLASVSHPNVLTVFDVGSWSGQVFMAMEFIEGAPIDDWCLQHELTWAERVELFAHAGEGLAAAHSAGLIHRDVKPDNIMVGSDGRPRVMDFGLARAVGAHVTVVEEDGQVRERGERSLLDDELERSSLTKTGAIMGTPAFMSPEQHLGADIDAHTDQFSLCVALYICLYGQRPFTGMNRQQLALEVCSGQICDPDDAGDVPEWVLDVLKRGMSPRAKDRFDSMSHLVDALREPPRRARWPLAAGAGVLATLATLAAVSASGGLGGAAPDPPVDPPVVSATRAGDLTFDRDTAPRDRPPASVPAFSVTIARVGEAVVAATEEVGRARERGDVLSKAPPLDKPTRVAARDVDAPKPDQGPRSHGGSKPQAEGSVGQGAAVRHDGGSAGAAKPKSSPKIESLPPVVSDSRSIIDRSRLANFAYERAVGAHKARLPEKCLEELERARTLSTWGRAGSTQIFSPDNLVMYEGRCMALAGRCSDGYSLLAAQDWILEANRQALIAYDCPHALDDPSQPAGQRVIGLAMKLAGFERERKCDERCAYYRDTILALVDTKAAELRAAKGSVRVAVRGFTARGSIEALSGKDSVCDAAEARVMKIASLLPEASEAPEEQRHALFVEFGAQMRTCSLERGSEVERFSRAIGRLKYLRGREHTSAKQGMKIIRAEFGPAGPSKRVLAHEDEILVVLRGLEDYYLGKRPASCEEAEWARLQWYLLGTPGVEPTDERVIAHMTNWRESKKACRGE